MGGVGAKPSMNQGWGGVAPLTIYFSEFVQVSDQYTTNVEYKIHHISKTKIITKNGAGLRNLFQNIENLLVILFLANYLNFEQP